MSKTKDARLTARIIKFVGTLGLTLDQLPAGTLEEYKKTFAKNMADKKAARKDYITPPRILNPVRSYYPDGRIPLDPATDASNPTDARIFFTEEDNGLELPWGLPDIVPEGVAWGAFVNPPFGDEFTTWLTKISAEAAHGIDILGLYPVNRFEQAYLHEAVFAHNPLICWITERVAFLHPETRELQKNNNYPSMIVGYNSDEERFMRAFSELGTVGRWNTLHLCTADMVKVRQAERRRTRAAARKAAKEVAAIPAPDPKVVAPRGLCTPMSPGAIKALNDAAVEGFF